MLDDTKKTHTEVKHPQISIPRLADYMAASKCLSGNILNHRNHL
jgi:hypothetical protein